MLGLERPSVDKNNSMILNLVLLLLFIILRSLDLFLLHLLGLLLALAIKLSAAVHLVSLGILKMNIMSTKFSCEHSYYNTMHCTCVLDCIWHRTTKAGGTHANYFCQNENILSF